MRLPPSSAVLDHTSAFPLTSPPLSQTPREAGHTSHLVSRPKPPSQRPHCCLSQSEYVTGLGTLSPEAGLGKTQLPGPLGTTAGPRPSPGLPARAVGRACDRVLPAPRLGSWRGLLMPLRVSSHFGRISLDPLGPPVSCSSGRGGWPCSGGAWGPWGMAVSEAAPEWWPLATLSEESPAGRGGLFQPFLLLPLF